MPDIIMVALISAGVSGAVAFVVSTLKIRAEEEALRREHEHAFESALFKERVIRYPSLFALLSNFAKLIRKGGGDRQSLSNFQTAVNEWNNENAMFFTPATSRYSAKLRYFLSGVVDEKWPPGGSLEKTHWETVRKLLGYFEDFLKGEIGITTNQPVRIFANLDQANMTVDKLIAEVNRAP